MTPRVIPVVLALPILAACAAAAEPWLRLDFDPQAQAGENRSGLWTFAPGVRGSAALLDGFTSVVSGQVNRAGNVANGATLQGWVACGAYPMHEGPLLDLLPDKTDGVAVVLTATGRVGVRVRVKGELRAAESKTALPLYRWHHVAAVLETGGRLVLAVDGAEVASLDAAGLKTLAPAWQAGRSRAWERPDGTLREEATAKAFSYFDGALDSWTVEERPWSSRELAAEARAGSEKASPLPPRVLPAGPAGPGPFGAFTTTLHYYPQWDAHWRVGAAADVVVRFDSFAGRLVFWRGTSYIPHWVTENGIWYTNEFNETWGDIMGCGEPMSDKQCRYSRVAVLESGPARAVVHWRYALADVFYSVARPNPDDGWGDWSDEVYTIYPDGTAVRSVTLHTTDASSPHEWHEGIVVMGPGWTPERAIEPVGLTLLDPSGVRTDFSWKDGVPPWSPPEPKAVSIHYVNTRSTWKPFVLVRPQDRATFNLFAKEIRRDVSMYPWWNHWPTNMLPSDGRYAFAADRPSHASLSNLAWGPLRSEGTATTKVMLTGLTDRPAEELMPLLRSWSTPALLTSDQGQAATYSFEERAYLIDASSDAGVWSGTFNASPASPLEKVALVVRGWGSRPVAVEWNGKRLSESDGLRVQARVGLSGTDLVVWIPLRATESVSLRLIPQ